MNEPKRLGKHHLSHGNNAARFLRDFGADQPGGAVVEMHIMRGITFLDGLLSSDPMAIRTAALIPKWLKIIAKMKPGKGPLCLGCETEFNRSGSIPPAFLITVPHMKDWANEETSALITGICFACAKRSDQELMAIARKHWGPGFRELKTGTA